VQVAPVYSVPDSEDWKIRGYAKCPAYQQRLAAWLNSDAFTRKEQETAALRAKVCAARSSSAATLNVCIANLKGTPYCRAEHASISESATGTWPHWHTPAPGASIHPGIAVTLVIACSSCAPKTVAAAAAAMSVPAWCLCVVVRSRRWPHSSTHPWPCGEYRRAQQLPSWSSVSRLMCHWNLGICVGEGLEYMQAGLLCWPS
jgi:hypothetical protein